LGVIMAWRSKCASHQASWGSVLWPLRALTSYGFARATFTTSSNTLKMGFQYEPVLSIMAWVHASCWIHSRSFLSSLTVVPNSRISDRASPLAGPVITQATKHFLPTSMPIQRSMTASIIVTPSCPGSDRRIVKDLLPRALRTNRGSPHDGPASFLYGLPPMELPAVPYDATILSHISISGDGGTRHVCFYEHPFPLPYRTWFVLAGSGECCAYLNQGRGLFAAPPREDNDAQLFTQSRTLRIRQLDGLD